MANGLKYMYVVISEQSTCSEIGKHIFYTSKSLTEHKVMEV